VPGYGITCTQRQIDEVNSNGSSSPTRMIRLLMAVFFSEETMANSSCYGSGTTEKNKLDDDIIAACISKKYKYKEHVLYFIFTLQSMYRINLMMAEDLEWANQCLSLPLMTSVPSVE